MNEGRHCLKCIIVDIFILYFKKYLHLFIQSTMFTGRVGRQINRLYAMRMIVKRANCTIPLLKYEKAGIYLYCVKL